MSFNLVSPLVKVIQTVIFSSWLVHLSRIVRESNFSADGYAKHGPWPRSKSHVFFFPLLSFTSVAFMEDSMRCYFLGVVTL